jgi:hypothetical protein
MKPLCQESFGVFPFSSKTMHDRTCSQGFLGIQSLVKKQKSYWCLSKQINSRNSSDSLKR